MSKYGEVRCEFFDEEDKVWVVDGWLTDNDNEEGYVIAEINPDTMDIKYFDNDAKTDVYAQEVIVDMLEYLSKETYKLCVTGLCYFKTDKSSLSEAYAEFQEACKKVGIDCRMVAQSIR